MSNRASTKKSYHGLKSIGANGRVSSGRVSTIKTIDSSKKLPSLPRNANFKSPYECDSASEVSTVFETQSIALSNRDSSTAVPTHHEQMADAAYKKKPPSSYMKHSSMSFGEDFKEPDFTLVTKELNFLHEARPVSKFSPQYYLEEVYEHEGGSDDEESTGYRKFASLFTRQNIMYLAFGLLSFVTSVVFAVFLTLFMMTQIPDGTDTAAKFRYGVLVFYIYLLYSKIYQFFVVIGSLKLKNNAQLALLFVYLFLFTVVDTFFTAFIFKGQAHAIQGVLEVYEQNGIDIYNDHGAHPHAEKQFHDNFLMPKYYSIVLILCSGMFLITQISMWVFCIAKDFNWENFKKTGASLKARKIFDSAQLFDGLLMFLGGLVPPFFFCAYIIPLQNTPFYINGLVLAATVPFVLFYNSYAYKKCLFYGLCGAMLYYCYLFFNLVQFLCVLEAKMLQIGILIQYYSALPIFLAFAAVFIINFRRLGECEFDYEIKTSKLNMIFLLVVNVGNLVLGALEVGFYCKIKQYSNVMYASNWLVSYIFGFCFCIVLTVFTSLNQKHYVNFLSLYLVLIFNCLIIIFEFSNVLYSLKVDATFIACQGIMLGVIVLMSIFCFLSTLLLVQLFRNNTIDKLGTYNIESYKANESYEIYDFKTKTKVVRWVEYFTASNIFTIYLVCVFSIQFMKFKTDIWTVGQSLHLASIVVPILMIFFLTGLHIVVKTFQQTVLGLAIYIVVSITYVAYPLVCMVKITRNYAAIENALYNEETTDLKISMTLSVIMVLVTIWNVGLSSYIIKLQRSLTYY